ncbi:hypothetical protein Dip510_000584 [Elusimicrobium posterum]
MEETIISVIIAVLVLGLFFSLSKSWRNKKRE